MKRVIPQPLANLIEAIGQLPGVGPRTAERYAYWLLRADPSRSTLLAKTIKDLHTSVSYCPKTFALIEAGQKISPLYTDPKRDKQVVAVVADPFDIVALEKTGTFFGTYHVLGGLVSPIEGIGPDQLRIKELLVRLDEDKVKELILATNASVEGESTALLITQEVNQIRKIIDPADHIVIIQADNPDADSLASSLALEDILTDQGKQVSLYCGVDLPTYLHYLPGWGRVVSELPKQFDAGIIVYTASQKLLEQDR